MLGSLAFFRKQLLDQAGNRPRNQRRQDKDLNFMDFGKTLSKDNLERRNEEGQLGLSQGHAVLLGPAGHSGREGARH